MMLIDKVTLEDEGFNTYQPVNRDPLHLEGPKRVKRRPARLEE